MPGSPGSTDVLIRPMVPGDWPAVAAIYREGIATGNATFETDVPAWEEWDSARLDVCRLLVIVDGEAGGWAALSPVSKRPVYRGVAEPSIYISDAHRGQGLGRALLAELIESSESEGIWMLQTAIFPENQPSIALHESLGFRVVGTRERIGQHHGRWRDTVLMERRSTSVGT